VASNGFVHLPFFAVHISSVDPESASEKFQHLSIQNEDIGATKSAEENPVVILPDHLQVANADCAHLSFGSFGSGAFSGLLSSNIPHSSLEKVPIPDESPSVNEIDVRLKLFPTNLPVHVKKCTASDASFHAGIKITMIKVL
jgi:hypothetical protein